MLSVQNIGLIFLCLFLFATPADGIGPLGALPLVKLFGLMAFASALLLLVLGQGKAFDPIFFLLMTLYVCWILFSFLWSSMPVDYANSQAINSQQSIKATVYFWVFCLLVFQLIGNARQVHWAIFSFIAGASYLALLALADYSPSSTTVRFQLVGMDANEMAVLLATAAGLAIYLLFSARQWWFHLLSIAYLPLGILVIFATGSRTGFVTLLLALLALIPLFIRAQIFSKLILIAVAGIAMAVVIQSIPAKTLDRLFSSGTELSQGTLSERSITWKNALIEWQKKPLAGHGLGSFRKVINKHNVDYTAHNSFVSIAVEQGIIGLGLYLLMIVYLLIRLLVAMSAAHWIFLTILLIVLAGQMTLTLHEDIYLWFVYTLAALSVYHSQPSVQPQSRVSRSPNLSREVRV